MTDYLEKWANWIEPWDLDGDKGRSLRLAYGLGLPPWAPENHQRGMLRALDGMAEFPAGKSSMVEADLAMLIDLYLYSGLKLNGKPRVGKTHEFIDSLQVQMVDWLEGLADKDYPTPLSKKQMFCLGRYTYKTHMAKASTVIAWINGQAEGGEVWPSDPLDLCPPHKNAKPRAEPVKPKPIQPPPIPVRVKPKPKPKPKPVQVPSVEPTWAYELFSGAVV